MAWQTPKTNWVSTDKVNIVDYNRWKNNLLYLKEKAVDIYGDFSTVTLYNDKTRTLVPLASELNALESVIATINEHTYDFNIGEGKTYVSNGHPLNHEDMNRIEGATLRIYETLDAEKKAEHRLAFTLGGAKAF